MDLVITNYLLQSHTIVLLQFFFDRSSDKLPIVTDNWRLPTVRVRHPSHPLCRRPFIVVIINVVFSCHSYIATEHSMPITPGLLCRRDRRVIEDRHVISRDLKTAIENIRDTGS